MKITVNLPEGTEVITIVFLERFGDDALIQSSYNKCVHDGDEITVPSYESRYNVAGLFDEDDGR